MNNAALLGLGVLAIARITILAVRDDSQDRRSLHQRTFMVFIGCSSVC